MLSLKVIAIGQKLSRFFNSLSLKIPAQKVIVLKYFVFISFSLFFFCFYFPGKIKEILEVELGIPKDKQELKGLVKRKVDDSVCASGCFPSFVIVAAAVPLY